MIDEASAASSGESDAPSERRMPDGRGKILIITALGLMVIMSLFSFQRWWVETGMDRYFAQPIPVGEYEALDAWETPTQDLGPDSRFVFGQSTDDEAIAAQFWYGAPTAEADYALNGQPVEKDRFERVVSVHPPSGISVSVEVEGQLSRLDACVPVP